MIKKNIKIIITLLVVVACFGINKKAEAADKYISNVTVNSVKKSMEFRLLQNNIRKMIHISAK